LFGGSFIAGIFWGAVEARVQTGEQAIKDLTAAAALEKEKRKKESSWR